MAEAELRRRNELGAVVDWQVVSDDDSPSGVAEPTRDGKARALLQEILTALQVPDAVTDMSTVEALLEQVRAAVASPPYPTDFPLPQAQIDALAAASGSETVFPADFPLPQTQVDALTPPAAPTDFPLPQAQVDALTPPASPTEFPLPAAQYDGLAAVVAAVTAAVTANGQATPTYPGVYGYDATSTTLTVPAGAKVLTVSAAVAGSALVDGTVTIGAGNDPVDVGAGESFTANPQGRLVGPATITFVGCDRTFVDWIVE